MSEFPNTPKEPQSKRFQFRLFELFVFITAFCITFALLGQLGWSGLAMRVVGSLFFLAPLVMLLALAEFYNLWRIQR